MNLPSNPDMLVSYVNMKLRDEYESLEAMCDDFGISTEELTEKLKQAGYEYNEPGKRFW